MICIVQHWSKVMAIIISLTAVIPRERMYITNIQHMLRLPGPLGPTGLLIGELCVGSVGVCTVMFMLV